MVGYFLLFQDTNEEPRKKQNPVMDFHESKQVVQSKSEKPLSLRLDWERKNKPQAGDLFKYQSTCKVA